MNINNILISFIVPIDKFTSSTIEFVKRNFVFTNRNVELIFVSHDENDICLIKKNIINMFSHKIKIKLLKIGKDDFFKSSFNSGILNSSGKYVGLLNQNFYLFSNDMLDIVEEINFLESKYGRRFYIKTNSIITSDRLFFDKEFVSKNVFLENFYLLKTKYEDVLNETHIENLELIIFSKSICDNSFFSNKNSIETYLRFFGCSKMMSKKCFSVNIIENFVLDDDVLEDVNNEINTFKNIYSEINYNWEVDERKEYSLNDLNQKLYDKLLSEEFKDLDVLHIGFFFYERHSLFKIVENVIYHCKKTKQNWISLQDNRIEDVIEFCNIVKPKILHIHFAEFIDDGVFQLLRYSPKIVATIHSEKRHPHYKNIHKLICINEISFKLNTGTKILIENTVWIDKKLIRKEIDSFKTCCLTARFHDFVLSRKTLDIYSKINSPVYIYGFIKSKEALLLKEYSRKYSNINVMDWSNYCEEMISNHSLFTIIKPIVDSSYQYDMNVMEASGLGIPCITTIKKQNYQKYVIDGYNGFQVKNSKEFVSKINYILNDENVYKELKNNALDHCLTLKNTMPEQYEEIYSTLL